MRPAASSTQRLRDQRQERRAAARRARAACSRRASARRRRRQPASKRSARRSSCANDLTTWTPDDRLLRDGRDVGELLLHVAEHGVGDAAVAVGGSAIDRRDRERDERELPAVDEEDGRHDDDRHDVLREEDQAVAEEEAHRLQVDRRARHELARLAAVVEAERQSEEVRVELVAHVVLDGERLLPGDHAPPVHERTAHETEPDDRGDLEHEQARVSDRPRAR